MPQKENNYSQMTRSQHLMCMCQYHLDRNYCMLESKEPAELLFVVVVVVIIRVCLGKFPAKIMLFPPPPLTPKYRMVRYLYGVDTG